MALDPRLLTPASFMQNRVLNRTQRPPVGIEQQFLQSIRPTANMPTINASPKPQVGPTIGNAAFLGLDQLANTTAQDDEQAKAIGASVFEGDPEFFGLSEENIASMATDDIEKVDDNAKKVWSEKGLIAQVQGGLARLQTASDTANLALFKEIMKPSPSPEKSKEAVNKFFGLDPAQETPVWADVAVSIGLSLLRGEGKKQAGDSDLGAFLKDVGVAGERGLKVAREGRAAKAKRKLTLNSLAFNAYREDVKNRSALIKQYQTAADTAAKNLSDATFKVIKALNDEAKFSDQELNNISDAMQQTVKLYPEEVRGSLMTLIEQNPSLITNKNAAEVTLAIMGLADNAKIDMSSGQASNITSREFEITDAETFNALKNRFPELPIFKSFPEFKEGMSFKVNGVADKTATGSLIDTLQQPTVSAKNTTPNSTVAKLQNDIAIAIKRRSAFKEDSNEYVAITAEIQQLQTAVKNALQGSTPDIVKTQTALREVEAELAAITAGTYAGSKSREVVEREIQQLKDKLASGNQVEQLILKDDGTFEIYKGPVKAIDAVRDSQKIQRLQESQAQFTRAAKIGDSILYILADPAAQQGQGAFAQLGGALKAVSDQFNNFAGLAAPEYAAQQDRYTGGLAALDNILAGPTGRGDRTGYAASITDAEVSKVFEAFRAAAVKDQDVASAVLDYAFALASSRETGKLTDKDVAAALKTLGGDNIDGLFTNRDRLIAGVSNAINLAQFDLGSKMNSQYKISVKAAKEANKKLPVKEQRTDAEIEAEYRFDPIKIIAGDDAELAKRMVYGQTRTAPLGLSYQSIGKYREQFYGGPSTTGQGQQFGAGAALLGDLYNTNPILFREYDAFRQLYERFQQDPSPANAKAFNDAQKGASQELLKFLKRLENL